MRVFIAVLILIFSLQSWTKADDIRDFQIEGISVGDSLLDHLSEDEIDSGIDIFYNDDEFFDREFPRLSFSNYDGVQISLKKNDKKYKIYAIAGYNFFENNINECFKKVDEVSIDISDLLKDFKKESGKGKHKADPSGKSKFKRVSYQHKTGYVYIECWDWSDEITREKQWTDNFGVTISSIEFNKWMATKAYK